MKVNLSQTRNSYHATMNSPAPVHYLLDRRMNQIPSVPQEIKLKIRLLKKKTAFLLTDSHTWVSQFSAVIYLAVSASVSMSDSNIKKLESRCIIWGKKHTLDLIAFAIHNGRMARGIVQKRNNRDILRSRDLFGSAPKN